MFKKLFGSAFLLVSLLLLTACVGSSVSKVDKPDDPVKPAVSLSELARSLTSEPSCIAKGGQWQRVGRIQQLSCVLPTSDAGKACTDASQCEMLCLATGSDVVPGTAVTGQCSASTNIFGCKTRVKDGKVEGTLCID